MEESSEFPKSIRLLIAAEFCERFSFCGLRTILSLYLRNILLFHENTATVVYHIFIMLCYIVPLAGAMLADSWLGRYRTILYFSIVYSIGNILICLAAIPRLSLPPVLCSMLGLLLIAIGTGGIKPCVAAFGGDQFQLPQQEKLLEQFFSVFYFTINFGGFIGMIVTPILRKSFSCFGDSTCYAIGFGFPAILTILSLYLFVAGRHLYRIKHPKENVILKFVSCTCYALKNRIWSDEIWADHWLDYAYGKYNGKLIDDMKVVFAILFVFIPVPLFWSLFDQQGSRWTFQASHMNGELKGIELLPDQMQVLNPAIVLLLIPVLDKYLYPLMERYNFGSSLLFKMFVGGLMASFAFVISGMLETKLEETEPVLPHKGCSHLNFINTLPCNIDIINPINNIQSLNSSSNYFFNNLCLKNVSSFDVMLFVPSTCKNFRITNQHLYIRVVIPELQVEDIIICLIGSEVKTFLADQEDLNKTINGKAKMRLIFVRSSDESLDSGIVLRGGKGTHDIYFTPDKIFSMSEYMELDPGSYKYSLQVKNIEIPSEYGDIQLHPGGVYTLIVQQENEHFAFSHLFVITLPNTVSMLWLIPQYILISIAEVMFAIPGLQFSFLQAPKSLRTVTIAAWYLSVAIGNFIVILVTQARLFESKAHEFFLFAGLLFVDMMIFLWMASKYQVVGLEADGSSVVDDDQRPLLRASEEVVK